MRGFDFDGLESESSRNRTGSRDAAFANLLYGTGLRVSEAASLLDVELPDDSDPGRVYFTCSLAAACAKGHRSRLWWLPRPALSDVLSYIEGPRAEAIARARAEGRYDRLDGIRIVEGVHRSRRLALGGPGGFDLVPLDETGPDSRLRLFRRTAAGLEPAALWLNENGMPRPASAWQVTFRTANERIRRAGLPWFQCTPHMLRHSFALRWYAVGRLLWDRRLAHLTEIEQRDFRAQFGDTWQFVQTLLGHGHPQTTVDIYLNLQELHQPGVIREVCPGTKGRNDAPMAHPRSFVASGYAAASPSDARSAHRSGKIISEEAAHPAAGAGSPFPSRTCMYGRPSPTRRAAGLRRGEAASEVLRGLE